MTYFDEISESLTNLGIHIESLDLKDAEKIDEFLFDRLSEKEVALLSLGVAVGMIQSVLQSIGPEDDSIPQSTQNKMIGTIDLALHRIRIVLAELGILEIGHALVEHVQPLLSDFKKLKGSKGAALSEIQAFEGRFKMHFESVPRP